MENPANPTPPVVPPQTPPEPQMPNPTPPASTAQSDRKRLFAGAKTLASVLAFIAGIVVAAVLINQFIFQSYYVDGTSMTPTLQNNDRLIIDKVERTFTMIGGGQYLPKRGQIVVLNSSLVDQFGRGEQLIKRVIGLPGEEVIIGNDGNVIVKNKQHPEGFNVNDSLGLSLEPTYVDTPVDVHVPDNSVFVMGDNRGPGGSYDSRAFGPINTSKIEGRLLIRIFPFNKTGFF